MSNKAVNKVGIKASVSKTPPEDDTVDLAHIEKHFIAMQIQMDSNDDNFNSLFSKGMMPEEIIKIRDANKNKTTTEDKGKRFTTDAKDAENIKKATKLLDEKIKQKKEMTSKKIKEFEEKRIKGDSFIGNTDELLKYYTEKDEWKYRVISKEFIRTQLKEPTGKRTVYSILNNIKGGNITINQTEDKILDFFKKDNNITSPIDFFEKIYNIQPVKEGDVEKTQLTKEKAPLTKENAPLTKENAPLIDGLTVEAMITSIFEIIKDPTKYLDEKGKPTDRDEVLITKRLLNLLEYMIEQLPQYYGEVDYKDGKPSSRGRFGIFGIGAAQNTDIRVHDGDGKTRNMPLGISSKETLNKISNELKIYIDNKTVSSDYRYKNIDRLLRCSKRFGNFNSRLIVPMFITINDKLLKESFPNKEGNDLKEEELIAHLLSGESILEIIKKDRDRWLEIRDRYKEIKYSELAKQANKHVTANVSYLLNKFFSKGGIAGFGSSEKKLSHNGKTVNIDEFTWINKKDFTNDLQANLENSITNINGMKLETKQDCNSSIILGSNIDNKHDDKEGNNDNLLSDLTPQISIVIYPSNCSSKEIGKHKCGEKKIELKVLMNRYIEKAKGRNFNDDNEPDKMEKNLEKLIKTNKSQPIHCVDKKDVPKSKPMQKDKNDKEQKNELPKPDLTAAQKPMPKLSQVVVGGKKKKETKKFKMIKTIRHKKTKRKRKTMRHEKINKRKTKNKR